MLLDSRSENMWIPILIAASCGTICAPKFRGCLFIKRQWWQLRPVVMFDKFWFWRSLKTSFQLRYSTGTAFRVKPVETIMKTMNRRTTVWSLYTNSFNSWPQKRYKTSTTTSTSQRLKAKRDMASVFTSIVINSRTVTSSVYTWDRCFLFLIYKGTVEEEFNLTVSKSVFGRRNQQQELHHIYIKCFFVRYQAFNFSITLDGTCLAKSQADVGLPSSSPSFV